MAKKRFNRKVEDIGNIFCMEHINLTVPDQMMATRFYVSGLGLTRDPYVDFGNHNVWLNLGNQQFHLPTGKAQVLRGDIHICVQNLTQLQQRLDKLSKAFQGTSFESSIQSDHLLVTCPWGNKIRCFEATADQSLGIPAITFKVAKSNLGGIARFYESIFKVPVKAGANKVEITVGVNQKLMFAAQKKGETLDPYDGHHIAIYTPDFSGPYEALLAAKRVSEESDQHQYRFKDIFDPNTGDVLFELEHEVRSLHHPMFNRVLVNRNANQTFRDYRNGRDSYYPL